MVKFRISLRSLQDVQEFVSLATCRAYRVLVGDDRHQVNGKSFMEMFCLNFSVPLTVSAECGPEELDQFLQDAHHLLVN